MTAHMVWLGGNEGDYNVLINRTDYSLERQWRVGREDRHLERVRSQHKARGITGSVRRRCPRKDRPSGQAGGQGTTQVVCVSQRAHRQAWERAMAVPAEMRVAVIWIGAVVQSVGLPSRVKGCDEIDCAQRGLRRNEQIKLRLEAGKSGKAREQRREYGRKGSLWAQAGRRQVPAAGRREGAGWQFALQGGRVAVGRVAAKGGARGFLGGMRAAEWQPGVEGCSTFLGGVAWGAFRGYLVVRGWVWRCRRVSKFLPIRRGRRQRASPR